MSETITVPEGYGVAYVTWIHTACNTMVIDPATHRCTRG